MQLAYLSRGTAKIELLREQDRRRNSASRSSTRASAWSACTTSASPSTTSTRWSPSWRSGASPLLGEPFVVEEIDRRLAFLEDNSGNLIELSAPATR